MDVVRSVMMNLCILAHANDLGVHGSVVERHERTRMFNKANKYKHSSHARTLPRVSRSQTSCNWKYSLERLRSVGHRTCTYCRQSRGYPRIFRMHTWCRGLTENEFVHTPYETCLLLCSAANGHTYHSRDACVAWVFCSGGPAGLLTHSLGGLPDTMRLLQQQPAAAPPPLPRDKVCKQKELTVFCELNCDRTPIPVLRHFALKCKVAENRQLTYY